MLYSESIFILIRVQILGVLAIFGLSITIQIQLKFFLVQYKILFRKIEYSIPVCMCLQTTTENFIYSTYTVMFVDPDQDPTHWIF